MGSGQVFNTKLDIRAEDGKPLDSQKIDKALKRGGLPGLFKEIKREDPKRATKTPEAEIAFKTDEQAQPWASGEDAPHSLVKKFVEYSWLRQCEQPVEKEATKSGTGSAPLRARFDVSNDRTDKKLNALMKMLPSSVKPQLQSLAKKIAETCQMEDVHAEMEKVAALAAKAAKGHEKGLEADPTKRDEQAAAGACKWLKTKPTLPKGVKVTAEAVNGLRASLTALCGSFGKAQIKKNAKGIVDVMTNFRQHVETPIVKDDEEEDEKTLKEYCKDAKATYAGAIEKDLGSKPMPVFAKVYHINGSHKVQLVSLVFTCVSCFCRCLRLQHNCSK